MYMVGGYSQGWGAASFQGGSESSTPQMKPWNWSNNVFFNTAQL